LGWLPYDRCAANERDELAPLHWMVLAAWRGEGNLANATANICLPCGGTDVFEISLISARDSPDFRGRSPETSLADGESIDLLF
jgi:hypothetical protein